MEGDIETQETLMEKKEKEESSDDQSTIGDKDGISANIRTSHKA
jgi:hypothetical protein